MGMIGTLVGLVAMLGNMADPKAIGPAMAVALLTTLYGAMLANVIFLPMKLTLEQNTQKEIVFREMIVSALRAISRGESPRNIQDQLLANLPPKQQEKLKLLLQLIKEIIMAVSKEAEEVIVEDAFTEDDCPKCPPQGAPAWMSTFADMATLLMAFFVLILSFAEFNVPKFKQISGSLKNAFGVQRVLPVVEQPKGTTILSLNFSPSPSPSVKKPLDRKPH